MRAIIVGDVEPARDIEHRDWRALLNEDTLRMSWRQLVRTADSYSHYGRGNGS